MERAQGLHATVTRRAHREAQGSELACEQRCQLQRGTAVPRARFGKSDNGSLNRTGRVTGRYRQSKTSGGDWNGGISAGHFCQQHPCSWTPSHCNCRNIRKPRDRDFGIRPGSRPGTKHSECRMLSASPPRKRKSGIFV